MWAPHEACVGRRTFLVHGYDVLALGVCANEGDGVVEIFFGLLFHGCFYVYIVNFIHHFIVLDVEGADTDYEYAEQAEEFAPHHIVEYEDGPCEDAKKS